MGLSGFGPSRLLEPVSGVYYFTVSPSRRPPPKLIAAADDVEAPPRANIGPSGNGDEDNVAGNAPAVWTGERVRVYGGGGGGGVAITSNIPLALWLSSRRR